MSSKFFYTFANDRISFFWKSEYTHTHTHTLTLSLSISPLKDITLLLCLAYSDVTNLKESKSELQNRIVVARGW